MPSDEASCGRAARKSEGMQHGSELLSASAAAAAAAAVVTAAVVTAAAAVVGGVVEAGVARVGDAVEVLLEVEGDEHPVGLVVARLAPHL